ncbi:hypothetical protein HN385_05125 [archaeon]|jgi:hypothetical protein|nr:hypothetical protein [archaeon]MBT6869252.1 hypothetical protein [archaeon]MBT7193650.1 hypothetical protein [archaeon]MBT7380268.1 hypothetical protein [archaeon]MBT7508513.1 hypothetical protein [archaeon]
MNGLGNIVVAAALAVGVSQTMGCASTCNDIERRGGLVGTYTSDYVVISQSGGLIMDVYKLNDVYVESETGSDGWRFVDNKGYPTFIGGDTKTIRVDDLNRDVWGKYHEYHMEFESETYRDLYNPMDTE